MSPDPGKGKFAGEGKGQGARQGSRLHSEVYSKVITFVWCTNPGASSLLRDGWGIITGFVLRSADRR